MKGMISKIESMAVETKIKLKKKKSNQTFNRAYVTCGRLYM